MKRIQKAIRPTRLVPLTVVMMVLLLAVMSSAHAGEPTDPVPKKRPATLWYRVEIEATITQKALTSTVRADRTTTLRAESNTAVILWRVGLNNFRFQAAFNGEVTGHEGKGRQVYGGAVRQCRTSWTERGGPADILHGLIGGTTLRGIGIGFYDTGPLARATRFEMRVQCGGRCTLYNCIPPHDDPPVQSEYKVAFLRPPSGSVIRHPAGGFERTRIVVEGSARNEDSGITTKYRIVFKRCPDQDLSRDCAVGSGPGG